MSALLRALILRKAGASANTGLQQTDVQTPKSQKYCLLTPGFFFEKADTMGRKSISLLCPLSSVVHYPSVCLSVRSFIPVFVCQSGFKPICHYTVVVPNIYSIIYYHSHSCMHTYKYIRVYIYMDGCICICIHTCFHIPWG